MKPRLTTRKPSPFLQLSFWLGFCRANQVGPHSRRRSLEAHELLNQGTSCPRPPGVTLVEGFDTVGHPPGCPDFHSCWSWNHIAGNTRRCAMTLRFRPCSTFASVGHRTCCGCAGGASVGRRPWTKDAAVGPTNWSSFRFCWPSPMCVAWVPAPCPPPFPIASTALRSYRCQG